MSERIPMDTVNLSFSVEDYIDSSSAEVTVNIDASLDNEGVELKNTIVEGLSKITPGVTWRFSNVNRTKDRTGRENWFVVAKARLTDGQLAVISKKCKEQGKTGLQYRVGSVDYTPTREEFEVARRNLRQKLNALIKAEISAMNSELDRNTWRVGNINFSENVQGHQPHYYNNVQAKGGMRGLAVAASAANSMILESADVDSGAGSDSAESSAGFEISQKMTMEAHVVISSVALLRDRD